MLLVRTVWGKYMSCTTARLVGGWRWTTSCRWSVPPGVATGFTPTGARWNVLATGHRRRWSGSPVRCNRGRPAAPVLDVPEPAAESWCEFCTSRASGPVESDVEEVAVAAAAGVSGRKGAEMRLAKNQCRSVALMCGLLNDVRSGSPDSEGRGGLELPAAGAAATASLVETLGE